MADYDGILLCNKPFGVTSHDVVSSIKQIIGRPIRIGHTGTLDPRATGLLIICLGRATKIAQFLTDVNKVYEAEIKLGITSPTFDGEGISDDCASQPVPSLTAQQLEEVLDGFKGKIKQRVPAYSAVKVSGRRLYKMARKGIDIETPEREVEIESITLRKMELPYITILVNCSKGTYIRTLANDIGEKIGCGAYLHGLIRTQVGYFELKDALTVEDIRNYREAGTLKSYIRPIESILHFPSLKVHETFTPAIIYGKAPHVRDIVGVSGDFNVDEYISLMDHTGKLMAVGRARVRSAELPKTGTGEIFTYVRVLN